jgi:hypothetical protein
VCVCGCSFFTMSFQQLRVSAFGYCCSNLNLACVCVYVSAEDVVVRGHSLFVRE